MGGSAEAESAVETWDAEAVDAFRAFTSLLGDFLLAVVLIIVVGFFSVVVVSFSYLSVTENGQQRNLMVFRSCLV